MNKGLLLLGVFIVLAALFALINALHSRWAWRQSEREARAMTAQRPPRPMPPSPAPENLQEVDDFYDGLRGTAAAAVDGACATHGLAHPCEACAAEQPLRELLEEVRQCFTRDDDLPNDLLPRIDAALGDTDAR